MSEVQQLEQQLKDAKHLLERRAMALRLAENRDFRTLILDGFCKEEAARWVQLSTDPALNAEQRADSLQMAQASGPLKRYLSVQVTMANIAERELPDIEEAIDAARAEEAQAEVEANAPESDNGGLV
jgi:alanine racemase